MAVKRRFPGLVAAALAAILAASCYWQKYDELVRTNVELLVAMAAKMESLLERDDAERRMAMNEYRYPLERARDFARIVRGRYGEEESFRRFEEFLGVYQRTLEAAERLRTDPASDRALRFRPEVERLRAAGAAVLAAVDGSISGSAGARSSSRP